MNIDKLLQIICWPLDNIEMVSDVASIIGALLTFGIIRSLRKDYSFSRDLPHHTKTLQKIQAEWNGLLAVNPVVARAVTESLSRYTSAVSVLKKCPSKEVAVASKKLLSLMKSRSKKKTDLSKLMSESYDLIVEIRGHMETEIRIRTNRPL